MKTGLWIPLFLLLAVPALADKIEWTCDTVADATCPSKVDNTDTCSATDGIDTFTDKAERDDKEKPQENRCLVSQRVVSEICGSEMDPAGFDLRCQDKDEESGSGDNGEGEPTPSHHGDGGHHHHRHHHHGGGWPGGGYSGHHGHHGGYHHHRHHRHDGDGDGDGEGGGDASDFGN